MKYFFASLMERRNTITETNTTIAVPEIKLVERNRFREFVLTVTWPIRFALKVVLILFVSLNIFFAIRATQPMDLPEARGMTFYQLMADRSDAEKEYIIAHAKDLSKVKEYHRRVMARMAGLYIYSYYKCEFPLVLSLLMPENEKLNKYVVTKAFSASGYALMRPRGEAEWSNFLGLAWEGWERASWDLFVTGSDNLRPVELPAAD